MGHEVGHHHRVNPVTSLARRGTDRFDSSPSCTHPRTYSSFPFARTDARFTRVHPILHGSSSTSSVVDLLVLVSSSFLLLLSKYFGISRMIKFVYGDFCNYCNGWNAKKDLRKILFVEGISLFFF